MLINHFMNDIGEVKMWENLDNMKIAGRSVYSVSMVSKRYGTIIIDCGKNFKQAQETFNDFKKSCLA